jgi:hypothetical protein
VGAAPAEIVLFTTSVLVTGSEGDAMTSRAAFPNPHRVDGVALRRVVHDRWNLALTCARRARHFAHEAQLRLCNRLRKSGREKAHFP